MDTITQDNQTARKADAKGRLSGFRPGALYWIDEGSGTTKVTAVIRQADIAIPVHKRGLDYLIAWGLDPDFVGRDGTDETGYFEFGKDIDGKRVYAVKNWRSWPEGFDYDEFARKANNLG